MKEKISFVILIGIVFCMAFVSAAPLSSITKQILEVEIPQSEIATDGSWVYNGEVDLQPGYFFYPYEPAKEFQKVVFKLDGREIAEIGACWYGIGDPVSSTAVLGMNRQIGYCYWIKEYRNGEQKTESPKKSQSFEESTNRIMISSSKVSAKLRAYAKDEKTDDLVKLSSIRITGLSAGSAAIAPYPDYGDSALDDTLYVHIPQKEIDSGGNWAYGKEVLMRPGYFSDQKFQKVVFMLNNEPVAEIGACWYDTSDPVSSITPYAGETTGKTLFCYWVNGATADDKTGEKKVSMTRNGPFNVSSVKGKVSANLEAWPEYYDTDDLVKLTNVKISGLNGTGQETCPVETTLIDEETTGIDLGGNLFNNCNFGTTSAFENLFNSKGAKISLSPDFSFGSAVNVFVSPNPEQICLTDEKARKWSTEKTSVSKCFSGESLNNEQINSLKTAFQGFYNTFPEGTVEKYLESIFAAKQVKSIKPGENPDSGFNGAAIEMKTFLYSASCGTIDAYAAKKTALHELAHLMDYKQCFIFGSEGDKKDPSNSKWQYTGLKAKDFYAINSYDDYLGKDWRKAEEKNGFIPVAVSQYAQSELSEDFAETTAYLLMNNSDTALISEKARTDAKLKQKILLIEDLWKEASDGKMDRDWWCDKIDKLDIDCSVPAKNMNDAIQKMNKKLLKGIGFN